jgi:peptide/nickel transport system permease protein
VLDYYLRRSLLSGSMLFVVIVLTFALYHLLPGDPAAAVLGKQYSAAAAERFRQEQGLDRPLTIQLWRYLGALARGDLGRSHVTNRPVAHELARRLPATLELSLLALACAAGAGITIGVISARWPGGWWDTCGLLLALAGTSLPIFFLGLLALQLFGSNGWLVQTSGWSALGLPLGGRWDPARYDLAGFIESTPGASGFLLYDTLIVARDPQVFLHVVRHLILPVLVLATVPVAVIARITRAAMLDALQQDYVRTARAKGLREHSVIWRHALRNALIPIVTTIGTQLGYLVGGAVLTETIFEWPGMGRYAVEAILDIDVKPLQGVILVVAGGFVVINLIVDISYALIDPRLRRGGGR